MSKKLDESLPLRQKPPKAVSLNKALIIGLGVIVVAVLLWSIFFGFGGRAGRSNNGDNHANPGTGVNAGLKNLDRKSVV